MNNEKSNQELNNNDQPIKKSKQKVLTDEKSTKKSNSGEKMNKNYKNFLDEILLTHKETDLRNLETVDMVVRIPAQLFDIISENVNVLDLIATMDGDGKLTFNKFFNYTLMNAVTSKQNDQKKFSKANGLNDYAASKHSEILKKNIVNKKKIQTERKKEREETRNKRIARKEQVETQKETNA